MVRSILFPIFIIIHYHNVIIKNTLNRVTESKVSRFALVGVINTACDFILLNLLRVLTHAQSTNTQKIVFLNVVSAGVIATLSFYLNRKYVFKDSGAKNHMFVPFLLITLSGIFVLQSLIIAFSLSYLDPMAKFLMDISSYLPVLKNFSLNFYETNIAKVFATIASMTWNYILYSKFVFNKN